MKVKAYVLLSGELDSQKKINKEDLVYNDALFTVEYERWYDINGESYGKSILKYDDEIVLEKIHSICKGFCKRELIKDYFNLDTILKIKSA